MSGKSGWGRFERKCWKDLVEKVSEGGGSEIVVTNLA